ncbi:MAG TPA: Gfo/Idh/MocA family oxidoreductase [Candidatus Tyrphobacter sp.]
MAERIRIGIVGAGFGVKAHLPALAAHPRFEVVALASPSSAATIAKERGIPHAYTSCAEMVRGCDLDAVTVASPPFAHHDDVLAALDAGKHVLCEKPFALDVAQAQRMLEASQRAGTVCALSHEFRWVPAQQALKELVENRHLQPLREIEISQLTTLLRLDGTRERGWWFERRRGGGIAGAWLSHVVDMSNWLAGRPPKRAMGFLRTANPERHDARGTFTSDVDDGAFALLDYGDGLIARLCADATMAQTSSTCAVHAENRTAVASGENLAETTLYSVDADETAELQCKSSPYTKFASVQPNVPYLMELYDHFADAIAGKPHALPSFAEAVETQKVLAAVGFGT